MSWTSSARCAADVQLTLTWQIAELSAAVVANEHRAVAAEQEASRMRLEREAVDWVTRRETALRNGVRRPLRD